MLIHVFHSECYESCADVYWLNWPKFCSNWLYFCHKNSVLKTHLTVSYDAACVVWNLTVVVCVFFCDWRLTWRPQREVWVINQKSKHWVCGMILCFIFDSSSYRRSSSALYMCWFIPWSLLCFFRQLFFFYSFRCFITSGGYFVSIWSLSFFICGPSLH